MRVFITKHALSKGIEEIEAEVTRESKAIVRDAATGKLYYADEWYTTPEAAIAAAERMRGREIAKHKRTIEILEKLVFRIGKNWNQDYKYNRNVGVLQYQGDELINEFDSVAHAVEKTGFNQSGISGCCRGELKLYKGYMWKYKSKID